MRIFGGGDGGKKIIFIYKYGLNKYSETTTEALEYGFGFSVFCCVCWGGIVDHSFKPI